MDKIGIIGSGAMGTGIAQVLLQAGHEVSIYDTNIDALKKSEASLISTFNKLQEKGKITAEQVKKYVDQLFFVQELQQLENSSLVIEAIIEDLEIKQSVFKQLEVIVSESCVLATNTSSLSIASIAAACKLPNRVIGIHFFNPAPLMALVEIIPAIQTDPTLPELIKNKVQQWGKLPVITKDTPGFIVNRVARPFYSEALRIADEQIADYATIDAAMTEIGGFRMGPFTLMDFIGHDVNYRVTESVFNAFYYAPRFKPSLTQKRLLEAGYFGKKSGIGFYNYKSEAALPQPSEDHELKNKIFIRIICMLINEAADSYYLNIASKEDLETAMIKGVNYPKGLLAWGEEIGWKNVLQELDCLYEWYHEERYRASPQIRIWAAETK
jgi:3-hydroxybutyryl-CoA dehydrogenase